MNIAQRCCVSALALVTLYADSSETNCEYVVRFEDYGAQSKLDKALNWHGLDVDFAKALLDEVGCNYRFVSVPWGRALKMLEIGEIDMMLSVSKTAQRMRYAYFIGPQRMETIVFAMNAKHIYEVPSVEALFTLSSPVAIQRDAYYGDTFEKRMVQEQDVDNHFIYVPDNQLKLNLLRHGRISGFLEEKYNILYQTQNNPDFMAIILSPLIVNEEPVYYAFSKQTISKVQYHKLKDAFTVIKNSGKLSQILKKYKLD
ncbi:polar amino acid transport system substrate-binding protein [Pseudoalteromonas citrea]|uniref:Polar amino acid transport system substrate-binding protein n=2 Tax=Pseudoalteromonas citrea TaxID=43655 RepID=A0AAD4AMR3_9GAMM|nr:transporter substrate-binding domain-containing protein [Pseudoalteromonas citrea]KAF7775592.1 polar amino acid transport system substrate-binding protein [Pseudoalteromonas citrea]